MDDREKKFSELIKAGKEFRETLGWNDLSEDEVTYKIIEALKGKEIADKLEQIPKGDVIK